MVNTNLRPQPPALHLRIIGQQHRYGHVIGVELAFSQHIAPKPPSCGVTGAGSIPPLSPTAVSYSAAVYFKLTKLLCVLWVRARASLVVRIEFVYGHGLSPINQLTNSDPQMGIIIGR